MKTGWQVLQELKPSESGQGCVEYGLILGLVAIVVIAIGWVSTAIGPVGILVTLALIGLSVLMAIKPQSVSDLLNSLTIQERESDVSPEKSPHTSDVASEGQSGTQRGGLVINVDAKTVQLIAVLAGVFQCIIAVIQLILTIM